MRTITEEIKLYTYSELSDSAKETALQNFREYMVEPEMITESFASDLEELGYPTDDIRWSLNCCQGDGMAFYGRIDPQGLRVIAARLMPPAKANRLDALICADYISGKINCVNSHYNHWNSMSAELSSDYREYREHKRIDKLINELEKLMDEECTDISKRLEREGYAEIECQESEEMLIEVAEANEWEFTSDGKIYR